MPGLDQQLKQGIKVLDVGCGSGRIINKLASIFPNSHFTGMDLSQDAIVRGSTEAKSAGLNNVQFVIKDLSDFHETAPSRHFDFITTFDAIHDQGQPLNVLKGIHKALKNDGVYLMQDISGTSNLHEDKNHPMARFFILYHACIV